MKPFFALIGAMLVIASGQIMLMQDPIPGPRYLLLYALLALGVNLLLRFVIWWFERDEQVTLSFAQDPYRIAALRGGMQEAIRVATFSLVDRGLLQEQVAGLMSDPRHSASARRPLERAIITACQHAPVAVAEVFTHPLVQFEAKNYDQELASLGLQCNTSQKSRRWLLGLIAILFLGGVSLLRILSALSRGHSNVLFLVILSVVALLGIVAACNQRLTAHGEATVSHMKTLFARLRRRASAIKRGGQTNDAVLLAAVFGFAALPGDTFAFHERLVPPQASSGGSDSSSSGGCGGGGCGGGCGGCG